MRYLPYSITLPVLPSTCMIAAEGAEEQPGGGTEAQASEVGGVTRVQTEGNPEADKAAMVENQTGKAPTEEAKTAASGEEAKDEDAGKKEPAKKEEGKGDFSFEGTVFEGLSPEMQGKIRPFAATFAENGTLNDAEVKEAANATGFSEAMVRQFMDGAKYQSSQASTEEAKIEAQFHEAAGGADAFAKFQDWSKDEANVSPAEVAKVNKALGIGEDGKPIEGASPDYEKALLLMEKHMAKWRESGGGKPARDLTSEAEKGDGGGADGVQPYKSQAEMQRAMSDPRYASDTAYREEVYARTAASNF